jgi:hypothetical protein
MTIGVLALLVGATGTFATSLPVRAAATPIGFGTPNVMDPMESVGEPTIVHSPASDNTVYASGPWGTGTQRSLWHASADLGETFRLVQQCPPTSGFVATVCPAPTAVNGTANPPGGGDTDQRLDSTGKDYFVDLWALACDRVATTTDHGATANQNAYGCNSPTALPSSRPDGSDRQWLAVFDPKLTGVTATAPDKALTPLTYMEYNNLQTVQTGCSYWIKSTDGINYSPANNDTGNFGCDGYPSVDQVTGKVFEASGCTVSSSPALCLNIGTPDSTGNLCFLDDPAAVTIGGNAATCPKGPGLITAAGGLAGDPDLLFTVSSMDTGRNLHITYAVSPPSTDTTNKHYQVFTTVAPANNAVAVGGCTTNCWNHWATPVQVSQAPSNVNVFPWMVAGGPGRSDSVWYGTSSFIDPSTNGGQAWNVYMNQVVWPVDGSGAVTLAAPSTSMVKVSPHPNHYNSICLQGTGCITSQGDRNLADFFSVTLDHSGAAEVEYDDTSNALEQAVFTPVSGLADHPGAPVVTIARQDSGPGLLGTDVTTRPNEPTATPTTGQSDPAGDALYPVIGGTNVPGLDLVSSAATGNVANKLALSADGKTLTVTMNIADLTGTGIANATTAIPGGQFLQYVTRWVQCGTFSGTGAGNCIIYYAMAETHVVAGQAGQFQFFGGSADSIDLCSVSACDPHVEVYPEGVSTSVPTATGNTESGTVTCPTTPSAATPCTIAISVSTADIGSPTASTLLEEVGSYTFASAYLQSQITNPQAEADLLPLLVDGTCCVNFQGGAAPVTVPEAPWAPVLLLTGTLLIGAGVYRRRRRPATA